MNRRHRIAMLLENNPYPADVRVRHEAESLVGAGHTVCVIAPRALGQLRRETVGGVEVRRFRAPEAEGGVISYLLEYLVAGVALYLGAARQLARGATVLHLHNPPDILFGAGLMARVLGRRVVFDHHDLFPELLEAKFGPGPWGGLARAAERATFAVAHHVVAANESHAAIAHERGRKRPAAVTVVRNGPREAALVTPVRARQGALEDPLLAYVGAISEQDGVERLAAVLRVLANDHGLDGARLRIVGDGDRHRSVEAAMAAAGVSHRVEITGWLPPDEVFDRIADADICVDPAPATELNQRSTMVKIAEYMAAGKPAVAYDLVETRRTLGDTGILVAAGDLAAFARAVAQLARDGHRRAELGARARQRARALTWERSEVELLAAYSRLERDSR